MADPVSWLLIENGWKVVDAHGRELGRVTEVDADEEKDIFSGVTIRTGTLGTTRFVPSERVTLIVEGCIETDATLDELG
jgi:sporulation protein YlmC with PRC-barrel domain